MNIVKNKITDEVVYFFDDGDSVSLKINAMIVNGAIYSFYNSATHEIVRGIVEQPEFEYPGVFSYDGSWAIYNQDKHAEKSIEVLENLRDQKLNDVVDLQYNKSDTTIDFFGKTLNTNMEAITELTGALDGMRRGKNGTRKVNMRTGRVLTDTNTVEAMVDAIDGHRQACHDRGYDLAELIEAATTIEELDAIDIESGWPA